MTELEETELAVLRMSAGGMTTGEMAFALDLSQADLEQLIEKIIYKLDVPDMHRAEVAAAAAGLLRIDL